MNKPGRHRLSLWSVPAVALAVLMLLQWVDVDGPFSVRADGQTTGVNGIEVTDNQPEPGQIVCFTPPGGVFFEWDFDCRAIFRPTYSSRTGGPVFRSFPFPGVYLVRCRAHQGNGTHTDADITVTVNPFPGFSVGLVINPPLGPAPWDVTLTATPSVPGEYRYLWDFEDDGRWDAQTRTPTLAHRYAAPGGFTARVGILEPDGRGATGTAGVTVTTPAGLISITGMTASPPAPRIGDRVTFTATASSAPTAYLWDFDNDGNIDAVTAAPSATWRFDLSGSSFVRIGARDAAGAETYSLFALGVVPAAAVPRCWITSPRPNAALDGDHVSVQAAVSPGFAAAQIQFFYRPSSGGTPPPAGDPSWISLGTAPVGATPRCGVNWDLTGFAPGSPFDLIAVATDVPGTTSVSSGDVFQVTVSRAAGLPDLDERRAKIGAHLLPFTEEVEIRLPSGFGAEPEASGDTVVTIWPEIAPVSYTVWRMHRRSKNPHPTESTLQARTFDPDSFRTFTIEGSVVPRVLTRVTRYLGGEGLDRLLDGRPITDFVFTGYQFDDETHVWVRLADAVYHPDAGILQASAFPVGDFALHTEIRRDANGEGGSDCGLLGAEVLLAFLPLLLRRRRR